MMTTHLTSDGPPNEFAMIADLPLDKEVGDMVVVKNEPGNEDGYKGWDKNDVAIYEDNNEEATWSLSQVILVDTFVIYPLQPLIIVV